MIVDVILLIMAYITNLSTWCIVWIPILIVFYLFPKVAEAWYKLVKREEANPE